MRWAAISQRAGVDAAGMGVEQGWRDPGIETENQMRIAASCAELAFRFRRQRLGRLSNAGFPQEYRQRRRLT